MSRYKIKRSQKVQNIQAESNSPDTVSLFPPDRRRGYTIALGTTIFALLGYLLRIDRVIGLMGDDGWYVVMAKSLATGQGYQLINSPTPGILPIYPPFYPFLLSIAYRAWPVFPENIYLLKSISIIAMMISGWLIYQHFVYDHNVKRFFGLAIAVVTVTSPAFVFLATSTVMSECLYTCMQLATVVVIERARVSGEQSSLQLWNTLGHKQSWRGWKYSLAAGALASGSFLTRSVGMVVIAAVAIYLIKSRLFPLAAVFILTVMIFVGPWLLYQQTHSPTAEQQAEQNSYIVQGYGSQLTDFEPGPNRKTGFLDRAYSNFSFFTEHHAGALILYPWFRAAEPAIGKGRTPAKAVTSLLICLVALVGLIQAWRARITSGDMVFILTIGLSILWVFFSVRLFFPIALWFFYYFGLGVRTVVRSLRFSRRRPLSRDWAWAAGALWVVISINSFGNFDYILHRHGLVGERPIWIQNFEENEETLRWVDRSLPKQSVLTSSNPSLLYLYTGRKTVGNTSPATNWELWKRMGIRYGVWLKYSQLNDPGETETHFAIPFQSKRLKLRVLDFGDALTRRDWKSD